MALSQADKGVFVHDLIFSVKDAIIEKIKAGKIPEEWDGHELRQYVADRFAEQIMTSVMKGKRLRDYKNDVVVNNL